MPWTAKSCGLDASTLALSRRNDPPMMVAKKPDHQREHAVKPSCRECRIVSANLWWTYLRAFIFARGAAGESITRHSLRPLSSRDTNLQELERCQRCGNAAARAFLSL